MTLDEMVAEEVTVLIVVDCPDGEMLYVEEIGKMVRNTDQITSEKLKQEEIENQNRRSEQPFREKLAKKIEVELYANVSYFGLAKIGEKWYGYQDGLRKSAFIVRGEE